MPLYCSACSGQYPNRQHVDFDAECDRGYGDTLIQGQSQGEGSNAPRIQMDDLILCEQCIKEGARIIGMVDGDELRAEIESLKRALETKEKLYKQTQRFADVMEEALTHKGIAIDHRKKPRKSAEMVA